MLKGLLKAVLAGTIAGTAFPVIILVFAIFGSSSSSSDVRTALGIAGMAILIPFALVLSSALVLGIPTTLILRMLGWENETSYTAVGVTLGFLVPCIILVATEGRADVFFAALPAGAIGALSGAVTARTWWRSCWEAEADLAP